jgi:hypothetical protein
VSAEDWTDRRLRHEVALDAEIYHPDGHRTTVRIDNLSLDGCCVQDWLRIGDRVDLDIPRVGRVSGQVRWAFGGRAGIRFVGFGQEAQAEG